MTNGQADDRSSTRISPQIAQNAEKEATTSPQKRSDQPSMDKEILESSQSSFTPARAIAGNPRRNEKRAASSRLKPSARAAVSVEPERDTPGIKAPTCATPTIIASVSDAFSILRRWLAHISAS